MSKSLVKLGAAAGAGYAGWKYIDEKYQVAHDIQLARKLLALKKGTGDALKLNLLTTDLWYETYSKNPNKVCFYFEDTTVTYKQVEERSNQVANWLLSKGLKKGDTAALLMENRPEFVINWLGMTKIGVQVAMINTSIKQKGLVHCVKISECKMLLFGSELAASVQEVAEELKSYDIFLYSQGEESLSFASCSNEEIKASPPTRVNKSHRKGIKYLDTFGYIYTSGTTGLPKAAIIPHSKFRSLGSLMNCVFGIVETDILYTCLPLFHSAGGGLGIGAMFASGCSVVIKKKFSASQFWTDCVKYKCTAVQYIGELCRYLILNPATPAENQHRLRIAIGNGLRPEIWDEFQERFNIPEVGEFYGATEGNSVLVNHCTTKEARGHCGRMGTLLTKIMGSRIAKFDVLNEEPIRDPNTGFCIDCDHEEAGELLFIIKPNDPSTQFVGYKNKKATEKKILRDVFVKGDKYFRTGDLLSRDAKGYFKFVDRIGDTFRWKGENCSTTEVTEVVGTFEGVEEVNVYGVQIPNNMDGRAPTAGITPVDGDLGNLDLKGLAQHVKKNLPSYAVPLFLRILPQMEVTATMKHQKVKLRTEGIELDKVTDPIYWLDPKTGTYEPFGEEEFKQVTQLKARL